MIQQGQTGLARTCVFVVGMLGFMFSPVAQAQPAGEGTQTDGPALETWVTQIDSLYRQHPQEALTLTRAALRHPNLSHSIRAHVLVRKAQAHEFAGEYDSLDIAIEALTQVGTAHAHAHAAFIQGRRHYRKEAYQEAKTAFEDAIRQYEQLADTSFFIPSLSSLGMVLRQLNALDDAIAVQNRVLNLRQALRDSTGIANTLSNIANIHRSQGQYETAIALHRQALALHQQQDAPRSIALTYAQLADTYKQNNDNTAALSYYEQAAELNLASGNEHLAAEALRNMAVLHEDLGHYDEAFALFSRVLTLYETLENPQGIATVLNYLGDLHDDQGDYLQAIDFYQRALAVFEQLESQNGRAAVRNNLGSIYLALRDTDTALPLFNEALAIRQEQGNARGQALVHINVGEAYQIQGDFSKAYQHYQLGFVLLEEADEKELSAFLFKGLGALYARWDSLPRALVATDSALAIAMDIGALPLVHTIHLQRTEILEKQGRFEEALAAHRAYHAAHDSLYNTESRGIIAELQAQYQTREQQRQIDLLEREQQVLEREQQIQQQWVIALLAGLGLLVIIIALLYNRMRLRRATLEATEKARRAEALQAAALKKTNENKSRFLANISHEFRTPLTLTFGPINDVLDGRIAVDPSALPHFERAQRNGHRLLRLINQLLELSRLDAGSLMLQAQPHDLTQFLREIVALFESLAQQRNLHFTTDLPSGPCWHVYDADKLEKVVVNLLSNAFKFTPAEGKVSLRLNIEDGGGASIEVADTGPGIAAEHVPHVFDRFYQIETASTRTYEGSGIGLALAKELVELHGGHIRVESTVGFGTRFIVFLPMLEAYAKQVPVAASGDGIENASSVGVPGMAYEVAALPAEAPTSDTDEATDETTDETTVLVVEDNADMRAYIRAYLEAEYQVLEAANGEEGVALAQTWVPDLVLSDVMMPKMDGLELCAALKADVRTSHIPVVLLTAKAEVEHRIVGFESGADAYLPKPFDADELRVRVRTLVDERRRLRRLFGTTGAPDAEPMTPDLPPREAAFLESVDALIDTHLSDADFGVDQLAEAVHLSRRQLLRKLQALTTESPSELLRRRRLEHAAGLLKQGRSVKEVADAVGFKNYASFSRSFSSTYGAPPSEYGQQA